MCLAHTSAGSIAKAAEARHDHDFCSSPVGAHAPPRRGKTRTTPMFNFLHRSTPRYPTIRQTLVNAGLLSATDPAALTVLERHGSYSGRRVNFFRAFNPMHATAGVIRIRAYADLDAHRDLVLGSGHVEHEGVVVLNSQPEQDHAV